MKVVGDRLAEIAAECRDPCHFDLFSRSAFNRYYYSVFLTVREALRRIDSEWARARHQALPDLLKASVVKRVRDNSKLWQRKGLISRDEGSRLFSKANNAASELSQLLDFAYAVRCVADYEPEEKVNRDGSTGTLAKCSLKNAEGWQRRADINMGAILNAYERLGLI